MGQQSQNRNVEQSPEKLGHFQVESINHFYVMLASIVIICLSLVLQPSDSGGVILPVYGDKQIHLPPVCLSQIILSASCPGCGLTRSFVSFAHGRVMEAFSHNAMGPILFILCVLQIPYRSFKCLSIDSILIEIFDRYSDGILRLILLGLVSSWILKTFFIFAR